MKKIFIILAIVLSISCNSDDNDPSSKNNLKGRWNWIVSSGGFTGAKVTPETSKQTKVLEFSGSYLKTYINGSLSGKQKFLVKTKKSIFGVDKQMIVIDKGNSLTEEYYIDRSFEIKGNKLYLSDECADCYTSEYERIK